MKRMFVLASIGACLMAAATAGAEVRMIQSSRADKVNAATSIMRRQIETTAKEKWTGRRSIVKDETTGELRRPTASEAAAIVRTLRQMTAPATLSATILPGGTRQGSLHGAFANVVLGRPRPDGTTETLCVQTFEEAIAFLGLEAEPAEAGN